jgi:hypothetical protein
LTMDGTVEMPARTMTNGSQPPEHTLVDAYSYPSVEAFARKWKAN